MILALDLARSTGWAVGAPEKRAVFGSFHISYGVDGGAAKMHNHVQGLIQEHQITRVFFEQPIKGAADRSKGGNYHKMRYLMGVCYLVEAIGELHQCKVYEVPIGTWRKHFLGAGNYKRDDAKRAALTRCKQLGYRPHNDDVAEAIGILDYACSLYSKAHGWNTSPLAAAARSSIQT